MDDLKKQVESILFSVGRKIEISELAKLVKASESAILPLLQELKGEYDARNSSLMIVQDGTAWKLTVREAFLSTVRKIVTQTELPKSVMETLAVIAYKAPVLQSNIIKVRTNKAYDHLVLLEQDGFVMRVKHGRTKMIRLAQKFFDYFDIPEDQLKQKFSNVLALEKAIQEKEGEIETKQNAILEQHEQMKRHDEEHKKYVEAEHQRLDEELAKLPEIDLVDDEGDKHKLQTYPTTPAPEGPAALSPQIEIVKTEGFETYGEEEAEPAPMPSEKKRKKRAAKSVSQEGTIPSQIPAEQSAPESSVIEEARKEAAAEIAEERAEPETVEEQSEARAVKIAAGTEKSREFGGKGIFPEGVTEDVQKKIDERVEELVHGHKPGPDEEHVEGALSKSQENGNKPAGEEPAGDEAQGDEEAEDDGTDGEADAQKGGTQ